MNGVTRRDASAWALSAGTLLLAGCGGGAAEATTAATPAPDPSSPSPPPVAALPEWNMPVSYTHLTLPTNREV